MIDILAINFVWHMQTEVHLAQHQLAWDRFCLAIRDPTKASPKAQREFEANYEMAQ
jgi:hypothetical protein